MITYEQLLARAADRLEREDWWQGGKGAFRHQGGPANCVWLAVSREAMDVLKATTITTTVHLWLSPVVRAIHEEMGSPYQPGDGLERIFEWNDQVGRSKEEAVTLLRDSKRHLHLFESGHDLH